MNQWLESAPPIRWWVPGRALRMATDASGIATAETAVRLMAAGRHYKVAWASDSCMAVQAFLKQVAPEGGLKMTSSGAVTET